MSKNSIAYIQYTNPCAYPPLEHSSFFFAQNDWDVVFLGIKGFLIDNISFPFNKKIKMHLLSYCPPGALQKIHYFAFCCWAILFVLLMKPSWVYASDLFSCPIALILDKLGFRIVYHEHDTVNENSQHVKNKRLFLKYLLMARKFVAQRARLCILPNKMRRDLFLKSAGQSNAVCVWNCTGKKEVLPMSANVKRNNGVLTLLYQGSVVPDRVPLTVIDAVSLVKSKWKLIITGYETIGALGYKKKILQTAASCGVTSLVEIYPTALPRKELFQIIRTADVGLSLMPLSSNDINMQHMTGASNKSFEYMACGLPLLVSNLPDWVDMFVRPGYGLACNPEDAYSIATCLNWFADHYQERIQMGVKGKDKILADWNYENQFAPVYEKLSNIP